MAVGIAFLKLLITGGLITGAIASPINVKNTRVATHYDILDYVKPSHYDIKLVPYIRNGHFYGECNITIYISRTTQSIRLHTAELTIFNIQLKSYNNKIYVPTYSYRYEAQIAVLDFDDDTFESPTDGLKRGSYILRIKFVGAIPENIGFFRISYSQTGDKGWLLTTHIQTTQARRIFPCWDDPAFKATFNISVKHHIDYVALSNMPKRNQELGNDNMLWTHFKKTPLMSTNQVGIVVTNLCDDTRQTSIVNMWSRYVDQVLQSISFARLIAEVVTRYLENDWTSLYKVPKVNYIVVPNSQEQISQTWGLIFYREMDVIYDVQIDSAAREIAVMRTVMHEITKQVVGKWIASYLSWSHLWLNEGFNVFFGAYVLDKAFPSSRAMDLFVIETQHEGLHFNTPVHKYTHFEKDDTDSEKINETKSDVSIILSRHTNAPIMWRVLQNVISDHVFWTAIRTYLGTYIFSNSLRSPDNLWTIMQTSLELDHDYKIKKFMDSWTTQKHYPIVHVIRNYKANFVSVLCNSEEKEYWVPVTYTVQSQCNFNKTWPDKRHWLTHLYPIVSFPIPQADQSNWVIVNIQQAGFYRVNYEVENWQKIARYLKFDNYKKIHVLNRAQLIDDAFHLAMQRELNVSVFVDLASYLQRETDYVAWYPMFKALEYMSCVFRFSLNTIKQNIKLSVLNLEKYVGYRVSAKEEYFTKLLREEALRWACILNSSSCIEEATSLLNWHLYNQKENKLQTHLKEWAFCKGLIRANEFTWDKMFNMYKYHNKVSKFLVCSEKPQIIIKYLGIISRESHAAETIADNAEIMQQNKIRIQNYLSILTRHAKKREVFEYILNNFEEIKPKKVSTVAAIISIVNHLPGNQLNMVKGFVKNNLKYKQVDEKSINSKLQLCRNNIHESQQQSYMKEIRTILFNNSEEITYI